ncbi:hypothetical protein Focb16_v005858 [Fusarium oxysporum f. sp. cubense]|uniref:Uncharacterized protein n=2 Tax=Fusarium oxysporum f. sp. cubense TaxID=61366 RepID=N4UTA9_FUSC1|nr:hypothetical protein FOC1_g10000424 [Fusarium oxysporum f. sp. cubense race 1]TVY73936.1 hypothetical protein Focb16_v005858 [Fusarium oxysporum f. sp. cubense]
MESYKSLMSLLLLFTHLAHLAQAVEYKWVFTYGDPNSNVVCHAGFSIFLHTQRPYNAPSAKLIFVECATNGGDPGHSSTTVLPLSGSQVPQIYITPLDPHTSSGDVGFEIGINQPALNFADRTIPAMNPRVNMYTTGTGVFLGHCSYRQGAIQLAQYNGQAEIPYTPLPTHDDCPAGTSQDRTQSIGRWLLCQLGCGKF